MVERFFRDISENRLWRGVFTSVPELTAAIEQSVVHHNANPKPFIWTATARDILQKIIRANSRSSSKQNATLQLEHLVSHPHGYCNCHLALVIRRVSGYTGRAERSQSS
jgi:hypothetical protein